MSSTPVQRVKAAAKAVFIGAVVTAAAFCTAVAFAPAVVAGAVLATGLAGTAALGFLNAVNVDGPAANCPPAGPANYQDGKKGRSAEIAQYGPQHHQVGHHDVSHQTHHDYSHHGHHDVSPSHTPSANDRDSEYAGVGGGW